MAWAKVSKGRKPIGWWYHKVMCEIGCVLFGTSSDMYYNHLDVMIYKYGINLYGEKI